MMMTTVMVKTVATTRMTITTMSLEAMTMTTMRTMTMITNNDNKDEDDAHDRDEDDDGVDDDDDDDDDDWSVSLPPYPVNRGLTRAKAPPRPPESLIYLFANTVLHTLYCAVPLIVLQASYTSSPPPCNVVEIWYLSTHFAISYYCNIIQCIQ